MADCLAAKHNKADVEIFQIAIMMTMFCGVTSNRN